MGFIGTTALLVMILLYGLFPRALERAIRFHKINRANDSVLLSISNSEYCQLFLDLNEMTIDIVEDGTLETADY